MSNLLCQILLIAVKLFGKNINFELIKFEC